MDIRFNGILLVPVSGAERLNDSKHQHELVVLHRIRQNAGSLFGPTDVFTDAMNLIGRREGYRQATQIASIILTFGAYTLKETADHLREDALQRFARLPSAVSYTGCVVLAHTDYYRTEVIVGFDSVFHINGYLLRDAVQAA